MVIVSSNGPIWSVLKIKGGLRFDGVDDYVDIADAPRLRFATPGNDEH